MLKFIFGTLPIILSEEARNKANILKYSSNEKKILINSMMKHLKMPKCILTLYT